jgi:hypothetical protein
VKNLVLSDESGALVWCYESSGVYSSHSFYAIVNFRGVRPGVCPSYLECDVTS